MRLNIAISLLTVEDWVWIPDSLRNEDLSFNAFIQGLVALGYNTIIWLGVAIFVFRASYSLFAIYKASSNTLVKSQITSDQMIDGAKKSFMGSITGISLLVLGNLILRIIIQIIFPHLMWIFG